MEKLPMCRICLSKNIRIHVVVNKNLREVYEKLTDNPFETEDSRPMLVCYFCRTKLKQCYQFQRECLEAEKLFAQMMKEDYQPNPLIIQDHPEFCNGFIQSPIQHISIVAECHIENIAIKEELPAVNQSLDNIIELKEEQQSEELELKNQENSILDVEDIPANHSESDSEDYHQSLMDIKIEVEEHDVLMNEQSAIDTQSALAAKKPKLESRRIKLEDRGWSTEEQTEHEISHTTVIRHPQNCTVTTVTKFEEPLPHTAPTHTNSSLDINCQNDSNNEDRECKISSKGIDSDNISKHQRLVQENPLTCEEQRCFSGNVSLRDRHTGEKLYSCEICSHSFNSKGKLTKHNRVHSAEKPYKCDVCQRFFSEKSSLTRHNISLHLGEKPYKCKVCQRCFTVKDQLTSHIRTHTGEKPYKCDVCQRSFNNKSNLIRHNRVHTGEKPYKCEVCQRCFTGKDQLMSHTRTHSGEKPYKCDICQNSYYSKGNLTKHNRVHTGEKPYKCDTCQRCFSNKSDLTKHIRTHTGEKPYKCDTCQRCFSNKWHLTIHIRMHTGEKPHKCEICHRSFSQKAKLTKHIRIHTGKKPYKCDTCQHFFSRKNSLTNHIHTNHTNTGEKLVP